MNPLIAIAVVCGTKTLEFEPLIRYDVEAGHTYQLWQAPALKGPWVEAVNRQEPTNNYAYTVSFLHAPQGDQGFFWLQVDDEPPYSMMPTNNVSTNAPPGIPGG